jgi:hypothetical protein
MILQRWGPKLVAALITGADMEFREVGMREQWLAVEHDRLHVVEEWPDGPRKQAALAAIHSKIESLKQNTIEDLDLGKAQGGAAEVAGSV